MPGAGARGNSARTFVAQRRQGDRIRHDDPAGVRLLPDLPVWDLLGRSGKMDPAFAVWTANIFFFLAGIALLYRVDRMPIELGSFGAAWQRLKGRFVGGQAG